MDFASAPIPEPGKGYWASALREWDTSRPQSVEGGGLSSDSAAQGRLGETQHTEGATFGMTWRKSASYPHDCGGGGTDLEGYVLS